MIGHDVLTAHEGLGVTRLAPGLDRHIHGRCDGPAFGGRIPAELFRQLRPRSHRCHFSLAEPEGRAGIDLDPDRRNRPRSLQRRNASRLAPVDADMHDHRVMSLGVQRGKDARVVGSGGRKQVLRIGLPLGLKVAQL